MSCERAARFVPGVVACLLCAPRCPVFLLGGAGLSRVRGLCCGARLVRVRRAIGVAVRLVFLVCPVLLRGRRVCYV